MIVTTVVILIVMRPTVCLSISWLNLCNQENYLKRLDLQTNQLYMISLTALILTEVELCLTLSLSASLCKQFSRVWLLLSSTHKWWTLTCLDLSSMVKVNMLNPKWCNNSTPSSLWCKVSPRWCKANLWCSSLANLRWCKCNSLNNSTCSNLSSSTLDE